MKPEIIITAKGHAGTMATLQSELTAHLLSEAPDRNAFLKQHAGTVRPQGCRRPRDVVGRQVPGQPVHAAPTPAQHDGFDGRISPVSVSHGIP